MTCVWSESRALLGEAEFRLEMWEARQGGLPGPCLHFLCAICVAALSFSLTSHPLQIQGGETAFPSGEWIDPTKATAANYSPCGSIGVAAKPVKYAPFSVLSCRTGRLVLSIFS